MRSWDFNIGKAPVASSETSTPVTQVVATVGALEFERILAESARRDTEFSM